MRSCEPENVRRWVAGTLIPICILAAGVAVVELAVGVPRLASGAESGEGTGAAKDQVESLIARLDGEEFSDRDAATRELISLGASAVPTVAEAASRGSLETSSRSFAVLKAGFQSRDPVLRDVAAKAIRELTQSENRAVAQRANSMLHPEPLPRDSDSDFNRRLMFRGRGVVGGAVFPEPLPAIDPRQSNLRDSPRPSAPVAPNPPVPTNTQFGKAQSASSTPTNRIDQGAAERSRTVELLKRAEAELDKANAEKRRIAIQLHDLATSEKLNPRSEEMRRIAERARVVLENQKLAEQMVRVLKRRHSASVSDASSSP